ncbi:MAG: anhydro-N-acetylmuramic acid kinase [Pirellulales bacterium]
MVEVHLLNRLRALAEHRRWLLGLAPTARFGHLTAALVAVQGPALEARPEVIVQRRVTLPPDVRRGYGQLRRSRGRPLDVPLLAARLAECQAALVDELAAEIAPVWQNISAVAIHGPGMSAQRSGLHGYAGLCDAARLADLTGLNVIDGFAERDVAQDGRGMPLLALPYWVLLHDVRKLRAVVHVGRRVRATFLHPRREASAAFRTSCACQELAPRAVPAEVAIAIAGIIRTTALAGTRVDEVILCGGAAGQAVWDEMGARLPDVRLVTVADLGLPRGSLAAAAVAVLGQLHLDHVPASLPALTGARTPRVLGRITPGSVVHWHRLVRELSARRPNTVTLRSAI